jgi:hypothetical protein
VTPGGADRFLLLLLSFLALGAGLTWFLLVSWMDLISEAHSVRAPLLALLPLLAASAAVRLAWAGRAASVAFAFATLALMPATLL